MKDSSPEETGHRWPPDPKTVKLELQRKLFHLLSLVYLLVYKFLGPEQILVPMAVWTGVVIVIELVRFHTTWGRAFALRMFGGIIRAKESERYTGLLYTTLGAMAVFLLFGQAPTIVTVSLLYLAFGDSASAVVGTLWGRNPFRVFGSRRTVEGSAAGFTVALIVGALAGLPPVLVVVGAVAFSFVDIFPLPPNDNIWIPVLPGALLAICIMACSPVSRPSKLPDIRLPTLGGTTGPSLATCPTEKCLTVYVTPWCGYCRQGTLMIVATTRYLQRHDIASRIVVGMDSPGPVRDYAAEFGPDTLLDPGGAFVVKGVPHFLVSDKTGTVLNRVPGLPPVGTPAQMAEYLELP